MHCLRHCLSDLFGWDEELLLFVRKRVDDAVLPHYRNDGVLADLPRRTVHRRRPPQQLSAVLPQLRRLSGLSLQLLRERRLPHQPLLQQRHQQLPPRLPRRLLRRHNYGFLRVLRRGLRSVLRLRRQQVHQMRGRRRHKLFQIAQQRPLRHQLRSRLIRRRLNPPLPALRLSLCSLYKHRHKLLPMPQRKRHRLLPLRHYLHYFLPNCQIRQHINFNLHRLFDQLRHMLRHQQ